MDSKFSRVSRMFLFLVCFICIAGPVKRSDASGPDCTSLLADTPPAKPHSPEGKQPKHVFIIVLENESFDATFGKTSQAPYLNCLAQQRGKLLDQYYAIGHNSLDNYIAMVSGQAPDTNTQSDCSVYFDFRADPAPPDADGQVAGNGCVYPASVKTVANQLDNAHLTWRGYMESMEHGYKNMLDDNGKCEHPHIGDRDDSSGAVPGHQYAAKHNPFVYFHSIIDDPKVCASDVPLTDLTNDLKSAKTTPNLAFISPNLCDDGHDDHCAGAPAGETDGLAAADRFLQKWVPEIMKSPAYQDDGMLIITFDEADLGDNQQDFASCCGEKPGPNSASPGQGGPGGGRIGAVIMSPFVKPGPPADSTPYNHYSLLKSIEVLFDLKPLGYAGQKGLKEFGPDVYDAKP
ncbi:MAG TPA: alkaline phosphatase family protein [Candidatus Binataceae bacterium]|nr:alkaline phosphatase family protein [Candidatus Binataceae bacterium]